MIHQMWNGLPMQSQAKRLWHRGAGINEIEVMQRCRAKGYLKKRT
jgi:hypothetical protein